MTLAGRYLFGEGPGLSYDVVQTDAASGASPHSVDTTGVQDGDLCVFAMSTQNSIPDTDGPDAGGWTKLWHFDTSSSEIGAAWYKIASSEGATFSWSHSSSTAVASALAIYRAPRALTLLSSGFVPYRSYIPGLAEASPQGLRINVVHAMAAGSNEIGAPTGDVYVSLEGQRVLIDSLQTRHSVPYPTVPVEYEGGVDSFFLTGSALFA